LSSKGHVSRMQCSECFQRRRETGTAFAARHPKVARGGTNSRELMVIERAHG